jgi:hypothetical protein
VEAILSNKRLRLIGDNAEIRTYSRDERRGRHGKMHHFFGSAVLIHDFQFPNTSTISPQRPIDDLTADFFIPNTQEQEEIVRDYACMAIKIAIKYLSCFKVLEGKFPDHFPDNFTHLLTRITKVVPLHLLPLNEMEIGDVVKILSVYIDFIEDVYQEAGISKGDIPSIQIGGDQLTRERCSSAKNLRIGTPTSTPTERFDKLNPISCEFFHMAMKFLSVCFKNLWADSLLDTTTLQAQKIRLQRSQVKPDVKVAYNACKDFFVSYTDAHILEAIMTYFKIGDITSIPEEHRLPEDGELLVQWATEHFCNIIRNNVGSFTFKTPQPQSKINRLSGSLFKI